LNSVLGKEYIVMVDLPRAQNKELTIYALAGRRVTTLLNESMFAVHHEVTWLGKDNSGHNVASGSYIYRLEAGEFTATRRVVPIREVSKFIM